LLHVSVSETTVKTRLCSESATPPRSLHCRQMLYFCPRATSLQGFWVDKNGEKAQIFDQ